jgi:hypothetical protein
MQRISALILVSACSLVGCSLEYEPCDTSGEAVDNSRSCPEDSICFDVKPPEGGAIRPGHVAVIWSQLDQADPDPEPQIAYQTRLDPEVRRIVIPVAELQPAKDQSLALCVRDCDDEARCACTSDVRVTTATLIAAEDTNADGVLDVRETATAMFGRASTVIVRSEKEHRPAPSPFDTVFAGSIRAGTHAYRFVGAGSDIRLGSPEEGQAFDLLLCKEPGRSCVLPFPNLRGF